MSNEALPSEVRLKRRFWTAAELATLRREYPDTITKTLAGKLGRPLASTYQKAISMGLRKSPAFNALPASGRLLKGDNRGGSTRFKPGQAPPNKGLRRPGWGPGRMKATQFKKGRPKQESRNYRPVGDERLSKDGYLERKVTDDHPVPARRWVAVHRLVWIEANGPVPPGHAICFKAGTFTQDRKAITLDKLELVTRVDLMKRNSYHTRYPREVGLAIQLVGALNRQINKRERRAEQD